MDDGQIRPAPGYIYITYLQLLVFILNDMICDLAAPKSKISAQECSQEVGKKIIIIIKIFIFPAAGLPDL